MNKNKNVKMCIAKKDYQCDCCCKDIKKGSKYYRANINFLGIYHFCDKDCADTFFNRDNQDDYICDENDI